MYLFPLKVIIYNIFSLQVLDLLLALWAVLFWDTYLHPHIRALWIMCPHRVATTEAAAVVVAAMAVTTRSSLLTTDLQDQ